MSFMFIQKEGHGSEPVEMDVLSEQPPLSDIIDFEMYLELKPPERGQKVAEIKVKAFVDRILDKRNIADTEMKSGCSPFQLVYQKQYKILQAIKGLDILKRTTYDWFKKDQEAIIKNKTSRDPVQQEEKNKIGRSEALGEEHKEFLIKKWEKGDYDAVGKFILNNGENKETDDEKDVGRGCFVNYVQTNEENAEEDSDDDSDADADELDENQPEDNYTNTYLASIQIQLRGGAKSEEV
ncbi:hypothetical protein G6F37_002433 [Rhizopus arrhizus]|nr:hypothetical protein G6F37_002433 [Rhizopus arrhizus]